MKITPEVIASLTGGKIDGKSDVEITSIAKIEEAKSGDISFIANPKYAHYAATTGASALLVAEDFEAPAELKATLIRVKDPYATVATLLGAFSKTGEKQGIDKATSISSTAELGENLYIGAFTTIGDGAKIADNVKIYPNCCIGDNVEIGEGTIIYPHVTVYDGCKIGKHCILHAGCVIGADGFGFAPVGDVYHKIPQIGIVVIEDDVEIGANTTVDRATMGETRISSGTKLDNLIQIAHNVVLGKNNVIAAQTGIAGSTQVGDSNRIGGQVGIAGHIKIGNRCEIGAQSGINKGYRDGSRVIGYPAVDIEIFARNAVLQKRLYDLFKEVDQLKKDHLQNRNKKENE